MCRADVDAMTVSGGMSGYLQAGDGVYGVGGSVGGSANLFVAKVLYETEGCVALVCAKAKVEAHAGAGVGLEAGGEVRVDMEEKNIQMRMKGTGGTGVLLGGNFEIDITFKNDKQNEK